jgi:hypothetical protein
MMKSLRKHELKKMRKEAFVTYCKHSHDFLRGTEQCSEITVRITCFRVEIWTHDLRNTKQEFQRFNRSVRTWSESGVTVMLLLTCSPGIDE